MLGVFHGNNEGCGLGPPYKSVECLDAVCGRDSAVRRALLSSLVGAVRCPTFFDRQSVSVPRAEKQGELGEPVGFGGAALDAEMALGFSDGDIGARCLFAASALMVAYFQLFWPTVILVVLVLVLKAFFLHLMVRHYDDQRRKHWERQYGSEYQD